MLTKQLALCRLHMMTLKFKQLKAKRNNNDFFFPRVISCSGHYFTEMHRYCHILFSSIRCTLRVTYEQSNYKLSIIELCLLDEKHLQQKAINFYTPKLCLETKNVHKKGKDPGNNILWYILLQGLGNDRKQKDWDKTHIWYYLKEAELLINIQDIHLCQSNILVLLPWEQESVSTAHTNKIILQTLKKIATSLKMTLTNFCL